MSFNKSLTLCLLGFGAGDKKEMDKVTFWLSGISKSSRRVLCLLKPSHVSGTKERGR